MMCVYYVYILEVTDHKGTKSFYTGYTSDLRRRIHEHGQGIGAKYCKGKKSLSLKYIESFLVRKAAMHREREIKSFTREQKINLIKQFQVD
ncbi:MAG: GIY-YIG nuclease family protein [Candidatus Lokiarchaeota archaeon]|nr:GIY-YIG nuclease family protein [Candidatus Lokiarchaeota archaeon]